jgi:hypothetical protein
LSKNSEFFRQNYYFCLRIITFVVITKAKEKAKAKAQAQVQIRTKVDYNAKGGFKLN